MARPMSNGRTSLSPTEREIASTMFELVAKLYSEDRITDAEVMEAAAGNMEYATDIKYPSRALHILGDTETTEEWTDVEKARREVLADVSPQAVTDVAAEFGVRLALPGTYSKKWADKAPAVEA